MWYKVTWIYVGSDKVRPKPQPVAETWIFHSPALWLISVSVNNGLTRKTIADKNLWATKYVGETGATDEETYGYYYQWGNNYGFATTWTVTTSSTNINVPTSDVPSMFSNSTFRTGTNDNYMSTFRADLWWDQTNTDAARIWPCPAGYHVMSRIELSDLSWRVYSITGIQYFRWQAPYLLTPLAWRRFRSNWSLDSVTTECYRRTSTPYNSTSGKIYYMYGALYQTLQTEGNRRGMSIRPMKNDPVQPDTSRIKLA